MLGTRQLLLTITICSGDVRLGEAGGPGQGYWHPAWDWLPVRAQPAPPSPTKLRGEANAQVALLAREEALALASQGGWRF